MINVNITTYPKRDKYLHKMLSSFSLLTLKPDRIILWLCHEEYDEFNLPETIISCKDLYTDIKWVDKNIYCHKRYEVFKYYNNDFNIMVDDDTFYPNTLIEELINHSKKTNNVTCYYSYISDYDITKRISKHLTEEYDNRKVALMGGSICWPPLSFPLESFKYEAIRDILATKCDESWLTPWLIKNNMHIEVLHDFLDWISSNTKIIDDSADVALWKEVTSTTEGIRLRENMFCSVVKFLHIEDKTKEIWPTLDIDTCAKNYKLLNGK